MAKCKLLAFLMCERATREPDGKVTLHGVFDRITIPRGPATPKLFFVYYKVVVGQPCTMALRVIDPLRGEIGGSWRDSIVQLGPVHSIWSLSSTLFTTPGHYALELRQETDDSDVLSLASTLLVVDKEGE
jgi:hypothetical protein